MIAVGQPAGADQFGSEVQSSSAQVSDTAATARPSISQRRMTADLAADLDEFGFLPWENEHVLPLADPTPAPAPDQQNGFVHPGVVYTKKDIARWTRTSPEYRRLAKSPAGRLTSGSSTFKPVAYGRKIDHGRGHKDPNSEMNAGFKDQSGFAKVQAVLWAADRKLQRRKKVISYLREFRSVKAIAYDDPQQFRLVAGWSCTNLAQAAELVNYRDADFRRFLTKVCYPVLDWPTGGNWHASFADSKLAIAAYAGDRALWRDAKAYFYERIAQSIYHSAYDRGYVKPLHKEDTRTQERSNGTQEVSATLHKSTGRVDRKFTVAHWGGWGKYPQIAQDLKARFNGVAFPDGTNVERRRDLAHVNMALGAWTHGARTILAQGEKLKPHAYDRLRAAFGYHAKRVLKYAKTGRLPSPAPINGDGGGARFQGYHGAVALFGGRTPTAVRAMLKRPEVRHFPAAGANHLVAEAFADRR